MEPRLDGSDEVRIVDYKTAKMVGEKAIQSGEKYDYYRQLSFYALLTRLDQELSSRYRITHVGIDFCAGKEGKYGLVEFEVTDEMLTTVKEEIRASWAQISDIEYWRRLLSAR